MDRIGFSRTRGFDGDGDGQEMQRSNWMPSRIPGCSNWLEQEEKVGDNPELPDDLAKKLLSLTVGTAMELEVLCTEVGSLELEDPKTRVVGQMVLAVKVAYETCLEQEREARDTHVEDIGRAKNDLLELTRHLAMPTPAAGEPTDEFFYDKGVEQNMTLVERLGALEEKISTLMGQQKDRSGTVQAFVKEMEIINDHMDRQPEDGEFEESGGPKWKGKRGWEFSQERLEKLRGRLTALRVLKAERAAEIVGLVVDCQELFRQLRPPEPNRMHTKVLMSLDAMSPADKPLLRTEDQTETSVGLSSFSLSRLKKLRQEMQEDCDHHTIRKEEHRKQIENLWDKLKLPKQHRDEHLAATKGITHSEMDKLEAELSRLRRVKAGKLTGLLKAARREIFESLELVGAKPEEVLGDRAKNLYTPQEKWTEALLEKHEEFLVKVGVIREKGMPVMEMVKKREDLVQKREHLGSFNIDYRARGAGLLSQRKLMDGLRKELKKLPPLTDDLRKCLKDWQGQQGFPFRYNRRDYLKAIEVSDMQWQHRKETTRTARNNTVTANNNNSSSSSSPPPASPPPDSGAIHNGTYHSTSSKGANTTSTNTATTSGSRSSGRSTAPASGSALAGRSRSPRTRWGASGTRGAGASSTSPPTLGKGGTGKTSRVVDNSSSSGGGSGSGSGGASSGAGGGSMADSRGGGGGGGHRGAGAGAGAGRAGGKVSARIAAMEGGGKGAVLAASKLLPSTPPPKETTQNPLLTPFTPSPARSVKAKQPRVVEKIYASTGGSHKRSAPPPPLPARPSSLETSQALARIQSSPDLSFGYGSACRGLLKVLSSLVGYYSGAFVSVRAAPPPLPARPPLDQTPQALARVKSSPDIPRPANPERIQKPATGAGDSRAFHSGSSSSRGEAGGTPPPLPERPSNATLERADLQAIRATNAGSRSLRSSVSASDVLEGSRLKDSIKC